MATMIIIMHVQLYTGELDNIEIDARDFEADFSNILTVSFTKNGLTAQQVITFTGKYSLFGITKIP